MTSENPRLRVVTSRMLRRPVPQLRTIDETAAILSVSPRSVRRYVAAALLPAHRFGRLVRISDDDIAAFLAANRGP
jgi:excisionase family DNA binding protein